jgi:N-acetylglucosaminyldiphosphoundecaprenol N-acetyl-beta-D-mannosaminyltransferase
MTYFCSNPPLPKKTLVKDAQLSSALLQSAQEAPAQETPAETESIKKKTLEKAFIKKPLLKKTLPVKASIQKTPLKSSHLENTGVSYSQSIAASAVRNDSLAPFFQKVPASEAIPWEGSTIARSQSLKPSFLQNASTPITTLGLSAMSFTASTAASTALDNDLSEGPEGQPCGASEKVNLFGLDFDNFSKQELLLSLKKGVVFTPNVDHLMKLRRDPDFVSVYEQAEFKVCDSQILMYASRFLGKPLKAKLSGADVFPWFCDFHRYNEDIKIFLLGGQAGVAREAQKRINARTGREIIVGEYSPPFGFEGNPQACEAILMQIEQSSANVLVVCLGAPKQEKWIATYRDRLPQIDIFMAVGAAVDFEAGCKPRAPKHVSELGLEWLYRLMCEPRRLWRRYLLEGIPFLGLVLAEKAKQISQSFLPRRA